MDFSETGGGIPPKSDLGYIEHPEITVVNRLNNGVSEANTADNIADPNNYLQAPNPQQPPIKITPPPPWFVQAKLPIAAPMPFTVLGAGKILELEVHLNRNGYLL